VARGAAASGGAAAAASLAAMAAVGRREAGSALAPVNAVSHIVWGDVALRKNQASLKYTATGFVLHVASALFWAACFEALFGRRARRSPLVAVAGAAAVTAGAAAVDLALSPRRIRPGFERRLSPKSVALVFASVGAGLAIGSWLSRGR
jgi:hypothetical protein